MAGAAVQKDPFMNDPLEPSLTASNEPQLPIGCIGAETHAAPEQIIVTAQIITIQGVRQRQECPDLRLEVRTKALIRVKQQYPITTGLLDREIFLIGEVRERTHEDLCAGFLCDLPRAVDAARICRDDHVREGR